MDEKVIFFNGFGQCLKEDTCNLSLVEPESPVIGSADQVVGEDVLNRNFQILVLDEGEMIMSDEDMRKGLKKPFFGSAGKVCLVHLFDKAR